jgi:hypothetical protein
MRDLQKEKLYKRKDAPNGYSFDLRLLSHTYTHIFPPFTKEKLFFILGVARVRKRNQNDASTLVYKKIFFAFFAQFIFFLCTKLHFFFLFIFSFFLVGPT